MKIPARQLAEPPLNTVSGYRRANRPAYHESYPGRFLLVKSVLADQQMAH